MGSTRRDLLSIFVAAALAALLTSTVDSQPLLPRCNATDWKAYNGTVHCSSRYGGKQNATELVDGGIWTHAYRELTVVPNVTHQIYGEFYPLAVDVACDNSAKVTWCTPSVVVCPGRYKGERNPPSLAKPP